MASNDSFITNDHADLTVPIVTEIDLDINPENILNIVAYIFPRQEDTCAECRIEFEEVIDKLINYYETGEDRDNLNQIYSIAHELTRQAERLRAVASKIEESEENYFPPLNEEEEIDGNSYELEEK
tara:strand:+ start:244 stop:621 length:378 start_codon:yes stop_codon:yes gene_type:complete